MKLINIELDILQNDFKWNCCRTKVKNCTPREKPTTFQHCCFGTITGYGEKVKIYCFKYLYVCLMSISVFIRQAALCGSVV